MVCVWFLEFTMAARRRHNYPWASMTRSHTATSTCRLGGCGRSKPSGESFAAPVEEERMSVIGEQERLAIAARGINDAIDAINALEGIPDPVARRRTIVKAANKLRAAADALDQQGWLTE